MPPRKKQRVIHTVSRIRPEVDAGQVAIKTTITDPIHSYQVGYLDGVRSVSDAAKKYVRNMRLFSHMDDEDILKTLLVALEEYSEGNGIKETEQQLSQILKKDEKWTHKM